MSISIYKQDLKDLNITHQQLADYIGHTREAVTNWLNGKTNMPVRSEKHITREIKEIIAGRKNRIKQQNLNKK
jgi:CRP-like cAMP-binding protein